MREKIEKVFKSLGCQAVLTQQRSLLKSWKESTIIDKIFATNAIYVVKPLLLANHYHVLLEDPLPGFTVDLIAEDKVCELI